jgi:hypothetical protein
MKVNGFQLKRALTLLGRSKPKMDLKTETRGLDTIPDEVGRRATDSFGGLTGVAEAARQVLAEEHAALTGQVNDALAVIRAFHSRQADLQSIQAAYNSRVGATFEGTYRSLAFLIRLQGLAAAELSAVELVNKGTKMENLTATMVSAVNTMAKTPAYDLRSLWYHNQLGVGQEFHDTLVREAKLRLTRIENAINEANSHLVDFTDLNPAMTGEEFLTILSGE